MARKNPAALFDVSVEFEGKTYSAQYAVRSKVVTLVHPVYGGGATQIGGSTAQSIARILLREALQGAQARGRLG